MCSKRWGHSHAIFPPPAQVTKRGADKLYGLIQKTDMHSLAFLSPQNPPAQKTALSAEQLLQLQAEILGRRHFAEAVTALAQQLAGELGCDRVSLGWNSPHGMKVMAVSYAAELHLRQETARLVASAMDEAAEQGVTLVHPAPEGSKPLIRLAHEELARRQGYALCTVPLVDSGQIVGALVLERRTGGFNAEETAAHEHLACVLAPLLLLKYENDLPLRQRSLNAAKASLRQVLQLGTPAARPVLFGLAAVLALLAFILAFPFTYRVSAPARLEGSMQRTLTAPTDGFLSKVYVQPGDRVKAGQLLAELADQDMLVEQRGLRAELAQNENALAAAQANGDRVEYGIKQAETAAVQAKLDLIGQQMERSRLHAPFDGVVIKGDLSQSIGAPLERGAELVTLAPDNGYRVVIEADESDVADLKPGQNGRLVLAALPAQTLPIRLERITSLATTENGRHYFAVYAALQGSLPALRPGLEGVIKIDVDRRSLLANWVARSVGWLRLKLWSWGA